MSAGRAGEIVLHVGMQQSGASMLQRALAALRPQLRARGVSYVSHAALTELPHLDGWRARADADPAAAAAFEAEVRALVEAERAKTVAYQRAHPRSSVPGPGVVLLSSDHLLGADNLDDEDEQQFRPQAVPALRQLITALGASRVRLVLVTQRQDRLMEHSYLRRIQAGRHHSFDEQFPQAGKPRLDYVELIERITAIPEVAGVRVRPIELVDTRTAGADPLPFVDDFLDAVGLEGALDLSKCGPGLRLREVYSRRALAMALGMNPHLETARDRQRLREFLLESFAAETDRQSRLIPPRERRAILAAYADTNRRLFTEYLPDLPADSYERDEATAALGRVLPPLPPGRPAAPLPTDVRGRALRLARGLRRRGVRLARTGVERARAYAAARRSA